MAQSPLKIWLEATRPKTLMAGVTPVIIGIALACSDGVSHAPAAACALVGAVLIQIGTNFANDYFDFVKGTDREDRQGPTRATAAGLVTPRAMLVATVLVFALTFLPGGYLVYRGGVPILAIGLVSILCGVLYTGGPFPLGYLGLGDLFVLVFFGPVAVAGTYYVQAQTVGWIPLAAGLSPGLFSVAILTVNNLRDADTDVVTGKKTLAVRFGKAFARWEYLLSLVAGALVVPAVICFQADGHWGALAGALALVPAIPAIRTVFASGGGPELNLILAKTGKLLLLFTVLFCAGWLLT